ncbi:MAG: type II toxin-antitoxin system prevent-host-death family antitoxin, partial [Vicinamibacterales bacterium]
CPFTDDNHRLKGQDLPMKKGVGIAELKARLSEHLATVRNGRTVTVLDRGKPVARIVPYGGETLEVRRATRRLRDLPLPGPPASATNSLALLLEDRQRR